MKKTELMIYNWVFVQKLVDETEGDKGYCQIKELRTADLDVYSFKELKYNEIGPIPLTTEILLKNGFKSKLGLGGRFILEIESFNCKIKFSAIDYVHELQNALTICKIKKEIIL